MNPSFKCSWIQQVIEQVEKWEGNNDGSLYVFPQLWGSSALGYGGVGMSAMEFANTVVIVTDNAAYVYLGRPELAYVIVHPTDKFFEDIHKQNMLPAYTPELVEAYGEIKYMK